MDVPHPETVAPAGADGHAPAGRGLGSMAVAEASVSAGAVTQAAGPTDAEWDARIEALRQL
ncbi:MAG: ATP-grasp domain-containing protein, partial [Betaproteobacteria bacterium]